MTTTAATVSPEFTRERSFFPGFSVTISVSLFDARSGTLHPDYEQTTIGGKTAASIQDLYEQLTVRLAPRCQPGTVELSVDRDELIDAVLEAEAAERERMKELREHNAEARRETGCRDYPHCDDH